MTFTASDGSTFEDEESYWKYEQETQYTFHDMTGESLTRLPGEIGGHTFELAALDDCEVLLLDHSATIRIDDLKDSKVFIGANAESVDITRCTNCDFTVASQLLKAQDIKGCRFFLYCSSPPVLEKAEGVVLGPFNGAYPQQAEHLQAAGLDPRMDCWWQAQTSAGVKAGTQLMSREDYSAQGGPWEPLGQCDPAIPLTWPSELPLCASNTTSEPTHSLTSHDEALSSHPSTPYGRTAQSPFEAAGYEEIGDEREGLRNGGMGDGTFQYAPAPFDQNHDQLHHDFDQSETRQQEYDLSSQTPSNQQEPQQNHQDPFAAAGMNGGDSVAIVRGPYEEWLSKWEATLETKREAEAAVARDSRTKAEQDLDHFYDQLTDYKAMRQARNREHERVTLERIADAEKDDNPFRRVVDLIGGGVDDGAGTDRSRFRGLLFQLKQNGLGLGSELGGEDDS